MAAVYKFGRRSLGSLIVMLMVLFGVVTLTTQSTKGHGGRMHYSGSEEKYPYEILLTNEHKIERRKHVDSSTASILPKRHVNITIVKAQTRSEATLHCNVSEIEPAENVTIFWMKRNEDGGGLSVIAKLEQMVELNTTLTYWSIDDKRFLGRIEEETDWCLHIRYTLNTDAGVYECQICHGLPEEKCTKTSVTLKLISAYAKIFGGSDKFIPSDKELPLRLSCVLINSIEPPRYIFWYHEDRMINYDLEDGATVREGPQGSELIFPKPNKTHVGNYTCVPSNAQPDSVMVYYGDAASVPLQDGSGGKKTQRADHVVNMLVLISTFHLTR